MKNLKSKLNLIKASQELLEECFAKYRAVAASHHVVINAIEHLTYSRTASRYTDQIVWSRIQHRYIKNEMLFYVTKTKEYVNKM